MTFIDKKPVSDSISFDETGLLNAYNAFKNIDILGCIKKIEDSLAIIESNWTGPQHTEASGDKEAAEENIATAKNIMEKMNKTLETIKENAHKIKYNG